MRYAGNAHFVAIRSPAAKANCTTSHDGFEALGAEPTPRELAWAAGALNGIAGELLETPAGERNHNKLNACAFRLGRMIARDWIDRAEVEHELLVARPPSSVWCASIHFQSSSLEANRWLRVKEKAPR